MLAIVDYGLGNIRSVESAVEFLGGTSTTTSDPDAIRGASKVILPGVGSFRVAMENIDSLGLRDALREVALVLRRPFLGICLGMQLLAETGDEDGPSAGLGLVQGRVTRLPAAGDLKVPHIGFNTTTFEEGNCRLFEGLGPAAEFYFVHSFRIECDVKADASGYCDYGGRFVAAVQRGNIFGTQFHPEKSQTNGLRVLKNFLGLN